MTLTTAEKTLLVLGIFLSWGFGALIYFIIGSEFKIWTILGLLLGGALLWLIPFALLVLFSQETKSLVLAFFLGSLGFFLVEVTIYLVFGILLLTLGFVYWTLRIRQGREANSGFSVFQLLQGMGIFFTIVALFGAMLYFYSPFASSTLLEPKIPEGFFDVVFRTFLSAGVLPFDESAQPGTIEIEELKSRVRQSTNAALAVLARKYQQYIPIVFAAGAFLFLKVVLFLFRYILLFILFLLTKLFLRAEWLKKETVQVPREVVRF